MALSLNPATKVVTIPQADLAFVSGTLYTLDTNQFRKDLWDMLSSETYIWMPAAFVHNTAVSIVGTTYARQILLINGYAVEFEDGQYSVRLEGSNNDIWDIQTGKLIQNQVQVIPTNSAGLIQTATSGLTPTESTELADIHDAHYNRRKLDKTAKTETLYEDNKTTPKVVFDTNTDVATEGLTELTPQ